MKELFRPIICAALALFFSAISTIAQPVLTVQGTGADSDYSFQFSAISLDSPGLQTTFNANYANGPAGESFDQINYSGPSGVIRLVMLEPGGGVDSRTFEFDSFVFNGNYPTVAGSPDTGILDVVGSTDAPEPSSVALFLAGVGGFFLISRRRGKPELG